MNKRFNLIKTDLIINPEETYRHLKILYKENKFNTFERDRVVFMSLIVRKKYLKKIYSEIEFKRHELMVEKDYAKNFDDLLRKLHKLSVVNNRYILEELEEVNNSIIPIEAFVLYVDPNIKSSMKAVSKLLQELNKDITDTLLSDEIDYNKFTSVKNKMFANIQTSNAKRDNSIILVDIDSKENIDMVKEIVNEFIGVENIISMVETHSGYHILISNKDKNLMRKLFDKRNGLTVKYDNVELKTKNFLTVLAGTLQGGFITKLINHRDFK